MTQLKNGMVARGIMFLVTDAFTARVIENKFLFLPLGRYLLS